MVQQVRRVLAALVMASLPMLAPSVARAQAAAQAATHPPGTVEVRFRVALSDARDAYPVEGFRILVLTPRRDSIFARTDVTGGAQLWLEPGSYIITRYQGVEFDG